MAKKEYQRKLSKPLQKLVHDLKAVCDDADRIVLDYMNPKRKSDKRRQT